MADESGLEKTGGTPGENEPEQPGESAEPTADPAATATPEETPEETPAATPVVTPAEAPPPVVLLPVPPPRGPHGGLVPLMVIGTLLAFLFVFVGIFGSAGAGDVIRSADSAGPTGTGGKPPSGAAPSPTPTPHTEITQDDLRAVLTAQTNALHSGDVDAFLAPYDTTHTDLVAERRRLFANLRLIPFDKAEFRWDRMFSGKLFIDGTGPLTAEIVVSFVHQVSGVDKAPVSEQYIWVIERAGIGAPIRVTGVRGSTARSDSYPLAWDLAELVKAERPHVIMLAPVSSAKKVEGWADRAESAAKRDLALWKGPSDIPSRFFVFASPDDTMFAKAYGGTMPKGTVAFCAPMATDNAYTIAGSRITWDTDVKGMSDAEEQAGVMRHEMGHALVARFLGERAKDVPLWVVEGFAEYLEWVDRFGTYYVPTAREYVNSDAFTGKLPGDSELYGDDPETNGVSYHLSMTAIRYIADKNGAAKAFEFVISVYRDPSAANVDAALAAATGYDRATFESKWAKWVKSHV